jgi:hypothetical protein
MRYSALRGCLIAAFLIIHAAIPAQSQPPTPTSGQSESRPPKKDTAPDQNPPRPISERADQAAQKQREEATTNWLMVYLTGALAITSFLLFGIGLWQVAITRMVARKQLRAYVFVADVEIFGAGTDKAQAAVLIRNTGQTPAHNVTVSTKACAFNFPGEVTFEPTPVGPDSSRFVFGPDSLGRRNIPLHTIIGTPRAVTALKAGNGVLYVYGEILYKDVFGKGRRTQFRHVIGGSTGWLSDNKMFVCPDGNEAG